MHIFARYSVCKNLPGCLYAQICQVVCMHRFARLSVCTDLPGCLYAQMCPGCLYVQTCHVVRMHKFARLSVCTDLPGCLYAQICQVVCMHRFARAFAVRQCDKYQTQIISARARYVKKKYIH